MMKLKYFSVLVATSVTIVGFFIFLITQNMEKNTGKNTTEKAEQRAPSAFSWNVSLQIRAFLESNGDDFNSDAYASSLSAYSECTEDYHQVSDRYLVAGALGDVFKNFIRPSPKKVWSGATEFELMIEPKNSANDLSKDLPVTEGEAKSPDHNNTILYAIDKSSDAFPGFHEGQLYFFTLNIINLKKIPVAFKITTLDLSRHHVAFSYLKSNKSTGMQDIQFIQQGENVAIEHKTCFKSESSLRDLLYPFFHSILIDGFYKSFFSVLNSTVN